MGNRSLSKSGMFLIEMMISVLFFAICGGICLTIFVKAYQMSVESSELTSALNIAQQGAECFKEDEELLISLLNGEQVEAGHYQIHYNQDWVPVAAGADSKYYMDIRITSGEQMEQAVVGIFRMDYQIYEIEVKKYNGWK